MLVEICDVFTDQETESLRRDEFYTNIYEDYFAKLCGNFSEWRCSKSGVSYNQNLSRNFISLYFSSLDSNLTLLAFMDAFNSVIIRFEGMKGKKAFPSNEALLSSVHTLSDKVIRNDRLIMLCMIAYTGSRDRALTYIAIGLFEELLYKATIEKGLDRLNVLVCYMAEMILHNQTLDAGRIFMGVMWYYSLQGQIPEYVHNFYRRLQYGYWGITLQLTAWGVSEVDRFVDLAFWIDSIIDESAGLLHKMQVFQGMSVPLSIEVFRSVAFLADQDLRRFSIRFLALRAKPLWGTSEPLQAVIAELKESYSNSDLYRQVGALVVNPDFEEDMPFALRVERLSGISLVDIGRTFVELDYFELRELIEAQHDTFSNRGTRTERLAKNLLALTAKRQGQTPVRLVVGGRYRVFLIAPSAIKSLNRDLAGYDPLDRELYLNAIVGTQIYRAANLQRLDRAAGNPIIGREELSCMVSSMVIPNGSVIPWCDDQFDTSIKNVILNRDTIREIFGIWGEVIRAGFRETINTGGGDLLAVSEDNELYIRLGLKNIRLRQERSHICVEIALDNSIARFVVDFNWRIFIQGELDSQTALERGVRLEDVSSPFGAFIWGMLILSAIYEIQSGSYRSVKRSSKGKRPRGGEREGKEVLARKGFIRKLPKGFSFTKEHCAEVKRVLNIHFEDLILALGNENFTVVLPIIPEDKEGVVLKPVVHQY